MPKLFVWQVVYRVPLGLKVAYMESCHSIGKEQTTKNISLANAIRFRGLQNYEVFTVYVNKLKNSL